MAKKENKGGILSNEQVEQELARTQSERSNRGYAGAQDTGDQTIRSLGSDTQRQDGNPPDHLPTDDDTHD